MLQVFADDSPGEVIEAYKLTAHLHFLRLLSYADPNVSDDYELLVPTLRGARVTILDLGCGLAQRSRAFARSLKRDFDVILYLADIPTVRAKFLQWSCARQGINSIFIPCVEARDIASLAGSVQCCFATEFFEHVHQADLFLQTIDACLVSGGVLYTNLVDHRKEFMHVNPRLSALRKKLIRSGYKELAQNTVFVKRGCRQPSDR